MEILKEEYILKILLEISNDDKELFFKMVEKLRRRYKSHGDITIVNKIGRRSFTTEELLKSKAEQKEKNRIKRLEKKEKGSLS